MIQEKLIDSICATITNGNRVNRLLPLGGKIVMDHPLPFICVYRFTGSPDPYFVQLIRTQASYLIVNEAVDIKGLLTCITLIASKKFNAFLIFEFWADQEADSKSFKILCAEKIAPATVKSLSKGFTEFKDIYPSVEVMVMNVVDRHPYHLRPLFDVDETKELSSLLIGIQVPKIFEDVPSGNVFALLFRKFRRKFSEVIKKAAFEFIRVQTSKEFSHYSSLGKTKLDNLIRFTDKQLSDLSERMNFLMRITPVNSIQEWESFKKNNFEVKPAFRYRLISIDPELEKRRLYKIHIERIDDPTLALIFREKRMELEKQLTMLEERESTNFKWIGQSVYGIVDEKTIATADLLLHSLSKQNDNHSPVDCHVFAAHARKELEVYKEKFPGIDLQVQIRKDLSGVMVSKSHLLISTDFRVSENRIEALIQHEVGTHILTYCNGYQQPLQQMFAGFAGYEQLQEGLAVIAEYLTGGLTPGRLKLLAGRVRAVYAMEKGADFIETFRELNERYDFDPKTAYLITMRVFRGGGFTKDALYLSGVLQLLKYLQAGGNLEILYSGKFHIKHVPIIQELMHRKILKPPFLSPYFQTEAVKKRIEHLKTNTDISTLLTPQL